jgi:hypothetical protein
MSPTSGQDYGLTLLFAATGEAIIGAIAIKSARARRQMALWLSTLIVYTTEAGPGERIARELGIDRDVGRYLLLAKPAISTASGHFL